ncbi:MAG TPA: 3-carboxymuconate cyclase [Chloroflexi bacterium]|nr:3-carboxymuconate cyclase [Chloroflexota bacterium]
MYRVKNGNFIQIMLALALLLSALVGGGTVEAAGSAGAVYVLTNAATGNSVIVFDRAADGTLEAVGSVPTGGLGSGSGLGSQGALVLSEDNQWLFAVNAGSHEISIVAVEPGGLALVDTVASGGERPISLTVHKNLLYVLNAGGAGNVTGFTVGAHGELSPLAGSTRPLSGSGVGPAQVSFSPDGSVLVVTEKGTNLIDTYTIGADGLASGPTTHASAGNTPFGFAFGKHDQLIVSEASSGALSSYHVAGGDLQVVSASAGTNQTAACWVVITQNGKYAYTTNAGSGSISGYRVDQDGTLNLLDADGRTGVTGDGSSPIDMALSNNSQYLYVLNSGLHTISAFQVEADGSLTLLPGTGLPAGVVGLAAH